MSTNKITFKNYEAVMDIFNRDKTSAANKVTMRFLDTYGNYKPAIEPENFNRCPILLTQPSEDRWTPMHLSMLVLDRIEKVDVKVVSLPNGSHYPVEEEALDVLNEAMVQFLEECLKG